jgi:hypothetical protein
MSRYGYPTTGRAIPTCTECGVLVSDQTVHDQHHDAMDASERLMVATAANLLKVVNVLIEADIKMKAGDLT